MIRRLMGALLSSLTIQKVCMKINGMVTNYTILEWVMLVIKYLLEIKMEHSIMQTWTIVNKKDTIFKYIV